MDKLFILYVEYQHNLKAAIEADNATLIAFYQQEVDNLEIVLVALTHESAARDLIPKLVARDYLRPQETVPAPRPPVDQPMGGSPIFVPINGTRLREERLKRGLTQKALANLIYTDNQKISRWERYGDTSFPTHIQELLDAEWKNVYVWDAE